MGDHFPFTALTDGGDQIRSPAPTPSQWVIAGEEWDRLSGRFPEGQRVVLE